MPIKKKNTHYDTQYYNLKPELCEKTVKRKGLNLQFMCGNRIKLELMIGGLARAGKRLKLREI